MQVNQNVNISMKKNLLSSMIFNFTNLFFLINIGLFLLPSRGGIEIGQNYGFISIILFIEFIYIIRSVISKESHQTAGDIASFLFLILFMWELFTGKLNILDSFLYPTPGNVITIFLQELPEFLNGFLSSIELIAGGYILALALAVPLGLIVGWRTRLYKMCYAITKVMAPIPSIVYIPYAIAILPTFKSASIFIIFIGAFWPIFVNTLSGVRNVEQRIIDSARVLDVKEGTMLFKIILPGILPSVITGANIGLILSFIVLTAAEMIGASAGLGWYIKYFSDFADYARVVVGIINIGIVVSLISLFFDRIEKFLLRWK